MADRELVDEALPLLSVAIGMIMEDEVDAAVTALPADNAARAARFHSLGQASRDIAALADAAEVLLRRGG